MIKPASPRAEFIDIGAVDRFLVQNGSYTVLDWLLAEGRLAYADYAAWRNGNRESLDEVLSLGPADLDQLLAEVDRHGRALHLAAEPKEVVTWSTSTATDPLKASKRPETHRRLVQQWRRANPMPQFDLFMDNAAAMAESRLCGTLCSCQFDGAARDLIALSRLDPANKSLGHYQDLINYGRHIQTPVPADAQGILTELDGLELEVQPLARALLGSNARDYLALAWQRLAKALKALHPQEELDDRLHASYALAQIPDWEAARQHLEIESHLLKRPHWMQLLARACRATGRPETGLLWWLVRVDRHPHEAAAALGQCDDAVLGRYWDDFLNLQNRLGIELPESGFPGFVLMRRPGLVHSLSTVAPLEGPETNLIIQLIEARRTGQDEIALRKSLGELDQALLVMYLQVCVR